jgi:Fe-S-cluster containining protein
MACCKNHGVLVTFSDIRKFHQQFPDIDLYPQLILYAAPANEVGPKFYFDEMPPLVLTQDETEIDGYLGLALIADETGTLNCPWLDLKKKTCINYPNRPWVCRLYPHAIDRSGNFIEKHARCPVPWNLAKTNKQLLLEEWAHYKEEFVQFRVEIEEWNSNHRKEGWDELIAFILTKKISSDNTIYSSSSK